MIWICVICFMAGAAVGVVVMAVMAAAGRYDDREENRWK